MFCGLNCDYQNFILISTNTTPALAVHFDFSSFSSRPFLILGRSFFYTQGVFGLDFISFLFTYVETSAIQTCQLQHNSRETNNIQITEI